MRFESPDTTPAYIQVYHKLRSDITDGLYPYGNKLPSKRTLSELFKTSLITVEHALNLLIDEGYIEAKERSGYYSCYTTDSTFEVEETVYKINTGMKQVNFTFPPSVLGKAMRKVISEYPEEIMMKCPHKGLVELRNALSRYLKRSRNIDVDPEQIIIGAGAEYFYALIVQLLGRSRIYGVEYPSYEKIRKMYRSNGVKVDDLKMGNNGILTKELSRTPASVLHITPYHSFPTGITADASKRSEYIQWAKRNHAIIIEDDYDSEFAEHLNLQNTLFSMSDQNVIYMNTFNRTISPAIRVSYMIIPKSLISDFDSKLGFYSSTVSTFQQLVITELINNGSFERNINRIRRKRRNSD